MKKGVECVKAWGLGGGGGGGPNTQGSHFPAHILIFLFFLLVLRDYTFIRSHREGRGGMEACVPLELP